MWYAVLHEQTLIGIVDLPLADLASGRMQRFPAYAAIRPTVRAATAALLQLGFFGAAYPALPPRMRETVRLRHAISRAARLRLGLLDEQGASVQATFVNLLEAPADEGVVVVAGFGEAMAGVAAVVSTSAAPT
jgi:hypothetical protein